MGVLLCVKQWVQGTRWGTQTQQVEVLFEKVQEEVAAMRQQLAAAQDELITVHAQLEFSNALIAEMKQQQEEERHQMARRIEHLVQRSPGASPTSSVDAVQAHLEQASFALSFYSATSPERP